PDYANWPYNQGAPYVDQNGNGQHDDGEPPLILGDQTLYSVYTDFDVDRHANNNGSRFQPLGIEVQHTTFGFNRSDPLGNVVFFKLRVVNKGGYNIEDCYLSLWSDPDLGGSGDDLVGCDTTLSLGYCYNATNNDQQYESRPPAPGFDFFQVRAEAKNDLHIPYKVSLKYAKGRKKQIVSTHGDHLSPKDIIGEMPIIVLSPDFKCITFG
ncbi:MAG: hypothetical protein GY869_00465, partial [Planctomycetes bacterium]|nr:hypothetical protein [Planctomycetota bacterium]